MSLVDEARDFYVSATGFPEPLCSTRQLEGPTLCHHAIAHEGPLIIEDTLADPVYAAVPTVQSLGVRAYAGVPLRLDGHTVGSVCAVDVVPRAWSARDIRVLEELAASFSRDVALRRALNQAVEARDLARQIALEREELLASATHDLRNPLSALQISAELLEAHAYTDEVREELAYLRAALSQMQRMVDELFAPSSASPSLKTQRLASDVTGEVTAMLGRLAARNHVRLVDLGAVEQVWVSVDHAKVMRLFSNLIGNAIKFSPEGAAIYVGARVVGEAVQFSVRDSGTGMTPEQLKRVFERSWQANPDDLRGRGLGLDIARQVAVAHGGRLWAESVLGEGSTFYFELPIARVDV